MFTYLVYSRDTIVYIRVWKTFPRLLYLDARCVNFNFAICGDDSALTDVESSSEALVSEGL